jgi:putative hemolysin
MVVSKAAMGFRAPSMLCAFALATLLISVAALAHQAPVDGLVVPDGVHSTTELDGATIAIDDQAPEALSEETSIRGAPTVAAGTSLGMADPAALYCLELGYDYETVVTPEGEQGICILPNGERCDAWDFFKGKCWQEFSYCARQGYRTVTRSSGSDSYSGECAVCVSEDGVELGTVSVLMGLYEKASIGLTSDMTSAAAPKGGGSAYDGRELPSYLNWCDLGGCTSIKSQGSCGSCWAFGTVVPLESAILIKDGVEVDLSEQWLVSCNSDGWSCSGGWFAHNYHQWKTDPCGDSGAVLEENLSRWPST